MPVHRPIPLVSMIFVTTAAISFYYHTAYTATNLPIFFWAGLFI